MRCEKCSYGTYWVPSGQFVSKMTDNRSSSALFKRAEQLKRWEESDTNKQSPMPKGASQIQFSREIIFLAACTSGDKDEVQRLLKMGADINTANVDGLTALHQVSLFSNYFNIAIVLYGKLCKLLNHPKCICLWRCPCLKWMGLSLSC